MTDLVLELPYPLLDHDNQSIGEKALRIPPEMVLQIASGLDEPEVIALRYGYGAEEFAALAKWAPFVQEVARTRAELEKCGYDFTLDARLKAKELSNVLFLRAMNTDATFGQVHDAMRTYAELGDLKPKQVAANMPGGNSAPGFSINIILNGDVPKRAAIDITPSPSPLPVDKLPLAADNPFVISVDE